LNIKSSGVGLPEIGSVVSVTVLGKAHIFDKLGA
jgi:iron(III) transport system ATP-binding protein